MKHPHRFPVRIKLMLVILGTCWAALLFSGTVLAAFQILAFREAFVRDVASLSSILARNCAAAVAFQDAEAAAQILSTSGANAHVVAARITLPSNQSFAATGTLDALPQPGHEPRLLSDGLYVHQENVVLDGEPIALLSVAADYGAARWNILKINLGILAVVIVVSLLVAYLISNRLQRVISEPIQSLARTARDVAEDHDYARRATKLSNDELGDFTDSFNEMLDRIQSQDQTLRTEIAERERAESELGATHERLLEISRAAGMAEVATGVLHNVGNALNSVNVSTTLIANHLRASRLANLSRLARLVEEHQPRLAEFLTTDPRGHLLPRYLSDLAEHLESERSNLLHEVESLEKSVAHIKDIVAVQQNYARRSGVIEPIPPTSILEDAIRMSADALERRGIAIQRDYAPTPPVAADKHKALQIVINLVQNAKQALDASGSPNQTIRFSIQPAGPGHVHLAVTDNGIGIPAENLTRIFSHGFTTRKDGHGFGLHSGAIAASEMGGSLVAASDGPGLGATFTLELPVFTEPSP
jgi:signal transduction histidine kinase